MACDIGPYYSPGGRNQVRIRSSARPRRRTCAGKSAAARSRSTDVFAAFQAPVPAACRAIDREPDRARLPLRAQEPLPARRRTKSSSSPSAAASAIPRLSRPKVCTISRGWSDLRPQGYFFKNCVNAGVLSHFNSTASILTGNWQRVDDFGFQPPRRSHHVRVLPQADRRGPTGRVGRGHQQELRARWAAGSDRALGQPYGANVVLPKQLLLEAVQDVVKKRHGRRRGQSRQRVCGGWKAF